MKKINNGTTTGRIGTAAPNKSNKPRSEIPDAHADHPQGVPLVDGDGAMSAESIKLMMEAPTQAHRDALKEQALRQEMYGRKEGK